MAAMTPRQFAPLKEGAAANSLAPRLRGVVFDVDGTLWYVGGSLPAVASNIVEGSAPRPLASWSRIIVCSFPILSLIRQAVHGVVEHQGLDLTLNNFY